MGISRFLYCLKEGMKNIGRNIWFSLASTAIISACIFLFCLLFALAANVQYMVKRAQATVGITVFFEESLPPEEILKVKEALEGRQGIAKVEYVSAEEAWRSWRRALRMTIPWQALLPLNSIWRISASRRRWSGI